MFDINNIINAAINAAVNARLTEVLQQHANTIAPLVEQIHNLDAICQVQAERIAVLAAELIADKPAITIDTTRQIIDALSDTEHPLFKRMSSFMDAVAEQAVEEHCGIYDHDDYAEMASKVDDLPDFDDFVKSRDVEDTVRDVVGSLSFDISVS